MYKRICKNINFVRVQVYLDCIVDISYLESKNIFQKYNHTMAFLTKWLDKSGFNIASSFASGSAVYLLYNFLILSSNISL